uniref:BCL7-like protein n=1 Tax=Acrobeloides nanus TaxID=290746 RepID=A0A914C2L3_9BILA
MFSRSQRAETRNRAKDELKRVIMAVDKKRWVVLKDTNINVYKWIPVSGQPAIVPKLPPVKISMDEETNTTASNENSNDETNMLSNTLGEASNFSAGNEDSNTGFSETGFESDSNQTQTFDRVDYDFNGRTTGSTDFSALVREEADRRNEKDGDDEPPAKRTKL